MSAADGEMRERAAEVGSRSRARAGAAGAGRRSRMGIADVAGAAGGGGRPGMSAESWRRACKWLMKWLRILVVLLVIGVNLIMAFFITTAFLFRLLGTPRPLIAFLLTCFLGYAMLFATLNTIHGLVYRAARERMEKNDAVRSSLLDALVRISRGDFDVFVRASREDVLYSDIAEGINSMARQLGTLESMRQDFISNVSHEIQSPLTSIGGFAALIKSGSLSEERRNHYLDIIETESRRLSSLSDNLLKLSSLETGNAPLAVGEFRLDKQLQTVALMLEPQWAAKKLSLEAVLDRVVFYGDEGLLSQVWVNLIHNAIKFTPDGGTIRITLSAAGGRGGAGSQDGRESWDGVDSWAGADGAGGRDGADGWGDRKSWDGEGGADGRERAGGADSRESQDSADSWAGAGSADGRDGANSRESRDGAGSRDGRDSRGGAQDGGRGELLCSVSDTGVGIMPEDQIHIFERFYKVDKARDRSLGGNGLGLSLAKKIVALHGGRISISSEFGKGSTFSVYLPIPQRPAA
jgi:signal transduction histidine kinase